MDDHPPSEKQKFLIVRFSSIGDIVLTTPIIRAIHTKFPNAEIHYVVKKEYQIVIESNPYIDKIHPFQKNETTFISDLKNEKFDYVIDLQKNRKSKQLVRALGVSHFSFNKLNFKKWFWVYFKINTLPLQHIVDRYFEGVKDLGIQNDQLGLDFIIPDEQQFDMDDLPAVFEDGYVAVTLGSMHNTKRIPAEKIIEISKIIHKPMILLGGKDVVRDGEAIASQMSDRIFNFCGELDLYKSASVMHKSSCVLACDTGLMHIGAALNVPMAVLWGNTAPEFGMYPYMPQNKNLYRNFEITTLACRPCSKLGYKKCPRGHFKCMLTIDTPEIADWINIF
jgi:ADP-heptose:LPS heptosyltransferase